MSDADSLANEIRRVDGSHALGAGALAEALMPWLTAHDAEVATAAVVEFSDAVGQYLNPLMISLASTDRTICDHGAYYVNDAGTRVCLACGHTALPDGHPNRTIGDQS